MALKLADHVDAMALQAGRLRWQLAGGVGRTHLALEGLALGEGLSAPRPGLRGAAAIASAVALLPPATAIGYFTAAPYIAPTGVAQQYISADARDQAIDLTDASGRWLGVIPAAMRTGGNATRPPYVTLDTAAPRDWYLILVALEDRNLGSWRSVNGIDVISVLRSLPSAFTGGPGGSSLAQMLVRCMRHLDPSEGGRLERLRRKIVELAEAPVLYHRLGGVSSPMFKAYLARHLPLVQGGPGSRMGEPLHGLGLASRVLWGVEPDQLSLAQQAVLAAAVRRQVMLAPDGDPAAVRMVEERWEVVRTRAIEGLQLAFPGSPRAAAAIEELRHMPAPKPHFLAATRQSPTQDLSIVANPEARGAALARDPLILAQGEMLNRLGPDVTASVAAVRLTIDARGNAEFAAGFTGRLARGQAELGSRLAHPLLAGGAAPAGADVVAVATRDDRIVGYVSTSQEPLFDGALAERDAQFRYVPEMALRPVGSIAKAMLAVQLGKVDSPDARYCNAAIPDHSLHNANGSAGLLCSDPKAWVDVSTTFGESLNLPLVWRLRNVPAVDLASAAARYRLHLPTGVAPGVALPLGLATSRPADLMTMMRAIDEGAGGRQAMASEPSIVAAYRLTGETRWRPFPAGVRLDLSQDFAHAGVGPYVRRALSAPLAPGGSLAGVGAATVGVQLHLAKSGTSSAANLLNARDKYAIGAYRSGGHRYSWLFLVGSRDPRVGLGHEVGWTPLWPAVSYVATYGAASSRGPRPRSGTP